MQSRKGFFAPRKTRDNRLNGGHGVKNDGDDDFSTGTDYGCGKETFAVIRFDNGILPQATERKPVCPLPHSH